MEMTTESLILRSVLLLERPPEEAEEELSDSEAVGIGAAACVSVMPAREVSEGAGKAEEEEVVDALDVRDVVEDVDIGDEDDVVEGVVEEDDVVEEVVDAVDVARVLDPADEEDVDDSCVVLPLELVEEVVLLSTLALVEEVVLLDEVVVLAVLDTAEEKEEDAVKALLLGVVAATVPLGVIDHIQETTWSSIVAVTHCVCATAAVENSSIASSAGSLMMSTVAISFTLPDGATGKV